MVVAQVKIRPRDSHPACDAINLCHDAVVSITVNKVETRHNAAASKGAGIQPALRKVMRVDPMEQEVEPAAQIVEEDGGRTGRWGAIKFKVFKRNERGTNANPVK